jgi:cyclophilin family peptidyl-prolyl cis-trans isomerase
MKTSKGTITIQLDPKQAPKTVNNFVFLSKQGFYNGGTFHRVIPGFVIQGGDPEGTGTGGPGYQFADELPNAGQYKIGSVAMANSGPNTNGSQFFIVTGANGASLPPSYSLFGQVTEGQSVAEAISNVPRDSADKPLTPVTINSVTIAETGAGK